MTLKQLLIMIPGILAALSTGCKDKDAAGKAPGMQPVPVGIMKMQQRDVDVTSTWFGHLRGVEQADIRPEVVGKLIKRVYRDGTLVQKGDVLFEIEPDIYQAAVQQAEATLAAAEASVLQAEATNKRAARDEERYAGLVKSGGVSEKDYTDAKQLHESSEAALAAAKAQVKLAEAALQTARINLTRCTIRAPFTGLASKSTVSTGDLISTASATPLTTMSSVDPIRVDFAVADKDMLNRTLNEGYTPKDAAAGNSLTDFRVLLEGGAEFEHTGKVVAIDSEVSSTTGTVNFIGHIPNPDLKLRSGMAVRVVAKTGQIKDALLVPERAIVTSMNHRLIVVTDAKNEPHAIDVKQGKSYMLEVPNGDGQPATMSMVVVTGTVEPLADTLKKLGYDNPTEANVVVTGSQMAAMYSKLNAQMRAKGAPAGFGTVVPRPFVYTAPKSTVTSSTAKSE